MKMNLETATMSRPETTIHVTAPAALNRPSNHPSQTLPQRSPFGIQELLGLGNSESRQSGSAVSAVTPSLYSSGIVGQTPFSADHHHMTMAASRMAYFNAHAAVAAAFLPHNMGSAGHLGLHHHQATGKLNAKTQVKCCVDERICSIGKNKTEQGSCMYVYAPIKAN